MAEIDTKRIINLPDQSGYNSGDYVAIDNATNGTHRFPVASMVATAGQTVAPEYSASSTYAVGDFVIYDGLLYECTTAIETAEAWTAAHWTQTSAGSQIGQIKNDLSEFPNGNYPQMGAGYANQLMSGLKKEDQTPYNFRAVPYDATLEEVKKIVGGTIAWNQLAKNPVSPNWNGYRGTLSYSDGVITYTNTSSGNGKQIYQTNANPIPQNHVVFSTGEVKCAKATTVKISFGVAGLPAETVVIIANAWNTLSRIVKFSSQASNEFSFYIDETDLLSTNDVFELRMPQLVDLTLALGSTIADYVYSLESATAGTGVAWLKTHFPKQFDAGYQAYDAGTLKSIEGLSGKKTVGFNQWDEVAEVGGYANATGEPWNTNTRIRSKTTNYIPILPNTDYCFSGTAPFDVYWYDADKVYIEHGAYPNNTVHTSPTNAHFMRFAMYADYGTTYNHDICINLSDPTKNGTYEPYEAHSYALDNDVVLRGIPKVDASGNLYYDGDEYLPDGTVNRRYGIVDLGTLDYIQEQSGTYGRFYTTGLASTIKGENGSFNLRCPLFEAQSLLAPILENGGMMWTSSNGNISFSRKGYTTAAEFKTAMSGVMLVYELATSTTENADPYTTPQIVSPDGTEEYVYTDGAFELPVGHSSDYPVDVSGQLDDILDTPSANGTYILKATVTDGAVTYSWVADA